MDLLYLGLGAWPEVTLAMARQKALEARGQIAAGDDPIAKRRQARPKTFRDAALELIESKRPGWKNAKHTAQWETSLAPKISCETVRSTTISKGCGTGMALGMDISSKTGNTMFQADLEYEEVGGTKRRSLNLLLQHRF